MITRRMLEFNRPPACPWPDVTCAENEIAISAGAAENTWEIPLHLVDTHERLLVALENGDDL